MSMERVSGFVAKRTLRIVGAVAALAVLPAVAMAQEQQQAAPAQEADQLKFTSTSPIILINQVKTEKAADFESAWAAMRAAFAKSDKAEVKAFGDTLNKLYKVDMPAGPAVIYIFYLDPPSTAFSYNPVKILYETLQGAMTREEADAIYAKLKDAYQSINPWPLAKIG
jgi:hypothetical protein